MDGLDAILANNGLPAAIIAVILTVGRILFNREIAGRDRAEAEARELGMFIRDHVIPALIRSTEATQAVVEYLTEQRHLHNATIAPPGYGYPSTMFRPGGTIYGTAAPRPPIGGRHWAPGGSYDNP